MSDQKSAVSQDTLMSFLAVGKLDGFRMEGCGRRCVCVGGWGGRMSMFVSTLP